MTIDATTTLAALVDARPELAPELERRGLDYCCGGRTTLADACAEHGLDVAEVTGALDAVPSAGPAPWTGKTATELVEYLVDTHHRYLWDELPVLTALTQKILAVHGERHPELREVEACLAEIRADLEPHMMKEERVLFPMIRELEASSSAPAFHCGSLRNPISVMLVEHDAVGDLLARLRTLTDGYAVPADGCASYQQCYRRLEHLEADTHIHVHLENNVLFPLVELLEQERTPA